MTDTDTAVVPFVDWPQLAGLMDWRQGEHVALVGPTGAGKTTAALSLIERRGHVVMFSTKPADSTLTGLRRAGWRIIRQWPPPPESRRVLVHAPLADLDVDPPKVGRVIRAAINACYKAGRWCIVADDMQALNDTCGLARLMRVLLLNARSSDVSVVVGTQRPRWVPREVWTQCTHLLIWRCSDADDLRALSGLGNADTATIRATVAGLSWNDHETLYVNTRTGTLCRTIPPPPPT